jgi:hypothetical protein
MSYPDPPHHKASHPGQPPVDPELGPNRQAAVHAHVYCLPQGPRICLFVATAATATATVTTVDIYAGSVVCPAPSLPAARVVRGGRGRSDVMVAPGGVRYMWARLRFRRAWA